MKTWFAQFRKFWAQQSFLDAHDDGMPITAHLEELRYRLIVTAITLGGCFVALYPLSDQLLIILSEPMREQLYMLTPTEAFLVHLKLAFFGAIVVSLPMTLFQGWAFVAPGLYANEKKYALPFVILGTLCFCIGGLFSYTLILPFGLRFLLGYSGSLIQPVISVANYVTFVTRMILIFGVIFELPLIVVFLTKIGVVTPALMRQYRKYAIVGAFVVGAILTPPDVFTQTMLAGPLIVLYEISIWVSVIIWKRSAATEAE
jgi:sec-independent protein translocase protein TatC